MTPFRTAADIGNRALQHGSMNFLDMLTKIFQNNFTSGSLRELGDCRDSISSTSMRLASSGAIACKWESLPESGHATSAGLRKDKADDTLEPRVGLQRQGVRQHADFCSVCLYE